MSMSWVKRGSPYAELIEPPVRRKGSSIAFAIAMNFPMVRLKASTGNAEKLLVDELDHLRFSFVKLQRDVPFDLFVG